MSRVNLASIVMRGLGSLAGKHRFLGAIVLAAVLLLPSPVSVRAGEHGEAPPAAVRFHLALQGSFFGNTLTLDAGGVVNWTGDLQATISLTEPEQHTLSVVRVEKTDYVSADGSPYESFSEDTIAASLASLPANGASLPSAMSPVCSQASMQTAALPNQLLEHLPRLDGPSLQDLGEETVDGVQTHHIRATLDLDQLLGPATLGPLLQLASDCGAPDAGVDPSTLQHLLSGSSVQFDANLDESSRFPRRLDLRVLLPVESVDISMSVSLTPSDQPIAVLAPEP